MVTEFTEAPLEPSSESSQVTEQPIVLSQCQQPVQEEKSNSLCGRVMVQQMFIAYDINSMPSNGQQSKMSLQMTEADAPPAVNDTRLQRGITKLTSCPVFCKTTHILPLLSEKIYTETIKDTLKRERLIDSFSVQERNKNMIWIIIAIIVVILVILLL